MCIPLSSAGRNRTHGGWSRFLSVTLLHTSWTHQYQWAQCKMCSPFQTNHVIYERLPRGAMATLRSRYISAYKYTIIVQLQLLINTIIFILLFFAKILHQLKYLSQWQINNILFLYFLFSFKVSVILLCVFFPWKKESHTGLEQHVGL